MLEVDDLHAYYGKSHILQGVTLSRRRRRDREPARTQRRGPLDGGEDDHGPRAAGGHASASAASASTASQPHEIARAGLGYVPEDREIFPSLTVRENLLLGMKCARSRRAGGRSTTSSRSFRMLRERIDAPGGVLSGGEQQMLTICRTLMGDPGADHGRRADRRASRRRWSSGCARCSSRSPRAASRSC